MLKTIIVISSVVLMSAGGAVFSMQNYLHNSTNANLQKYMNTTNNTQYGLQNNSDLFLKANRNPNL